MTAASLRAGIDPIDAVHVMENHDEALHLWRQAGVRDRVLVHIDAHHDSWRVSDRRPLTIENFISVALDEGIVREMYWVVPDAAFSCAGARTALVRQVKALVRDHKGSRRDVHVAPRSISAMLPAARLVVCPLESLRGADEAVLLDVDVDYFVIPKVSHNRADTHAPWPWRWPVELLTALSALGVRSDFVTIAYSVDGCYTPLPWKYLGDELASRLHSPGDRTSLAGFERLQAGVELERRGRFEDARASYSQAAALLPGSAAPSLHLALLCERESNIECATAFHADARRIDPSYDTGFNSLGLHYLWQKKRDLARSEFERALTLNPADGYACVGLAELALERGRLEDAAAWYRRALQSCDELLDAHRGLADLCVRSGDLDEAAAHYERSLQLALHGKKPLSWHILTTRSSSELVDEDHCAIYAELAHVYVRKGELVRAIGCYQIACAASAVGVRLRLKLASLLARTKRWSDARMQLALAVARAPRSVRYHMRRVWAFR